MKMRLWKTSVKVNFTFQVDYQLVMDVDVKPGTSEEKLETPLKSDPSTEKPSTSAIVNIKYFECSTCVLRVQFEYFGKDPPWYKHFHLLEEAYVIEDPFSPPKRRKIIILGAHCVKCNRIVCKDTTCSVYFEGTYCVNCAKTNIDLFPDSVRGKLNKIVG